MMTYEAVFTSSADCPAKLPPSQKLTQGLPAALAPPLGARCLAGRCPRW